MTEHCLGGLEFSLADSPHSKRVEKQISDIQEKSENKKMEVSFSHSGPLEGPWFLEQQNYRHVGWCR